MTASKAREAASAEGRVRRAGMVRVVSVYERPYVTIVSVFIFGVLLTDGYLFVVEETGRRQRHVHSSKLRKQLNAGKCLTVERPSITVPTNLNTGTPFEAMICWSLSGTLICRDATGMCPEGVVEWGRSCPRLPAAEFGARHG